MKKIINLARRRKIFPHCYEPKELKVTEYKAYEVHSVSNVGMEYVNELKFLIINDAREMVWIEEYSVEDVPRIFNRMFKDIRDDLTIEFC